MTPDPMREKIARIIDALAFQSAAHLGDDTIDWDYRQSLAREKADEIRALLPTGNGVGEGWLDIALKHLDGAAEALRQHGDEYRAQLIEAGAHAIRMGSTVSPAPPLDVGRE